MSKFERRVEGGTLRLKDMQKQLLEDPSEDVFEFERKFWDVHLQSPKIEAFYKKCRDIGDFKRDRIEIGVVELENRANLSKMAGEKISGPDLLKEMIAERFSLFSSFKLNPTNWECDFCLHEPEKYTIGDFEKFVSVYTQLSSIGEIGTRAFQRHLGTYNNVRMRKAYEKLYLRAGEKIAPNEKKDLKESKEVFRTITQSRLTSKAVSRDLLSKSKEKQKEYLDGCLSYAMLGTTLLYTADDVESNYEGCFPQLIVKNLGTVPKYVDYFHEFNDRYMPAFAEDLNVVLSKLKDS